MNHLSNELRKKVVAEEMWLHYYNDKTFKNKAQALNDRINFMHNPDPIFDRVLDDIFGNG